MTTPLLTETELVAWKTLHWAVALIMNRFRGDLARVGLTVEEFDVLVHLAPAPEQALPLQELTRSMVLAGSLSRSGLTRLLDRMEASGLIRRHLNREDRRRFDVRLTPNGRRRFDSVWPVHQEGIRSYFAAHLAPDELMELQRIVAKLVEAHQSEAEA